MHYLLTICFCVCYCYFYIGKTKNKYFLRKKISKISRALASYETENRFIMFTGHTRTFSANGRRTFSVVPFSNWRYRSYDIYMYTIYVYIYICMIPLLKMSWTERETRGNYSPWLLHVILPVHHHHQHHYYRRIRT